MPAPFSPTRRMDLARAQVQRHVGQRLRGRELLADARARAGHRRGRGRSASRSGRAIVDAPRPRRARRVDLDPAGRAGPRPSRRARRRRSRPRRSRRSGRTSRTRPAATSCGRRSRSTRLAAATIERLIWASSSVASDRPASIANPAAPTKAVWMLTGRTGRRPAARRRTSPPSARAHRSSATVIPGDPASSEAMRRPLVMTVSWLQPPWARMRRATARPVVLASMTIESPSWTRAAAAAPMRAFSSCCSRSRRSKAGSGRSRTGRSAPPWVRVRRPLALEDVEVLADGDRRDAEPRREVARPGRGLARSRAGRSRPGARGRRHRRARRRSGRSNAVSSRTRSRGRRGFGSVSTHLVPKRSAMSRN